MFFVKFDQIMTTRKSFKNTYLKYFPQLMAYGKTISRDEQLIEDVIQELFLSLWQKRTELMFKSSMEHYIFISFRNNLIRKHKAEQNIKTVALLEEVIGVQETNDLQRKKHLTLLLQKLPTRQREVLFLRYYKNKSYLEISEILGISYQVARNFSYRATQFLKKRFKEMQPIDTLALLLAFFN